MTSAGCRVTSALCDENARSIADGMASKSSCCEFRYLVVSGGREASAGTGFVGQIDSVAGPMGKSMAMGSQDGTNSENTVVLRLTGSSTKRARRGLPTDWTVLGGSSRQRASSNSEAKSDRSNRALVVRRSDKIPTPAWSLSGTSPSGIDFASAATIVGSTTTTSGGRVQSAWHLDISPSRRPLPPILAPRDIPLADRA